MHRIVEYHHEYNCIDLEKKKKKALLNKIKAEITALGNKIDSALKDATLKILSGPVVGNLDVVLQKHNIKTQQYHGRSFTGNHCHLYLKQEAYQDICNSVPIITSELTQNQNIILEAETIAYNFEKLNRIFAKIHKAVSHTNSISPINVPMIQNDIDDYFKEYIHQYPNQVYPKLHILKEHVTTRIEVHGFGRI